MLYAVVRPDAEVPSGLDVLTGSRVAVLYAEQGSAPSGDGAVVSFDRTIERIVERGTLLPMRFGTTVADLEELRHVIAMHEDRWAAQLEAVDGCVELIVHTRVVPSAEAEPAWGSPNGVREEVREVLSPWLRDSRTLPDSGMDRLAVLVPGADAAEARTCLERWAGRRHNLEFAVTGPWPPFSFCEAAA